MQGRLNIRLNTLTQINKIMNTHTLRLVLTLTFLATHFAMFKVGKMAGIASVQSHIEKVGEVAEDITNNVSPKVKDVSLDKAGEMFNNLLPKK